MIPHALLLTHAVSRLQMARERVAHGAPSLALALAGHPYSTALARISEAEDARHSPSILAGVMALTEAMALLEEAREAWGTTPAVLPAMVAGLAPCGLELRMHLPDAQRCADMGLAWEDAGGLSRPQALCVVHLAACLAMWRATESRLGLAAEQVRAEHERHGRERAAVAARAIWGNQSKPTREQVRYAGPRSLRDLAHVANAFDQWEEEDA